MRKYDISALVLLALASCVQAGPVQLGRRQDADTMTKAGASAIETHIAPTTTGTHIPASTTISPNSSQTVHSTGTISDTTASPPPSSTISITQTTTTTAEPIVDELPLAPRLTPGWGVAGAILLITGLVYTLIGIKNSRLQTFFSTAYLAGVSTAVLIVYLLYPPIPDGVQGAYVVACVITGLLLGGVATIFHEMTEGFGCLVGGFCLAMWLLTLKAGGLLTKSGDKVIFITVFSIAGFATYFVQYIRGYAQIALISFTGATVIVIGIDCFSQAGLKEFWAYIWNINPNLFPPDTTSYPLTKGVTVETALIIILTIVGVISQLRLWKVIHARRTKKAEEQAELDRKRELEETAVGQQIEAENARERREWEKMYGIVSEDPVQISEDATPANTGSVAEGDTEAHHHDAIPKSDTNSETIELTHMGLKEPVDEPTHPVPGLMSSDKHMSSRITVRVARDLSPTLPSLHQSASFACEPEVHKPESTSQYGLGVYNNPVLQNRLSAPAPEVVPLPFTIPLEDEPQEVTHDADEDDDRSSFATFADDDDERSMMGSKRASRASFGTVGNRLSVGSSHLLRKLSSHSVLSRGSNRPFSELQVTADAAAAPETNSTRQSVVNSLRLDLPDGADTASIKTPSQLAALPSPVSPRTEQPPIETEASAKQLGPVELTADRLPNSVSRVASSYRTNEWAKHLSQAETPQLERLSLNQYNESEHNSELQAEAVAPVNVETLQRTDGGIPTASVSVPLQSQPTVDTMPTRGVGHTYSSEEGASLAKMNFSQVMPASSGFLKSFRRGSHRLSVAGNPPPIAEESVATTCKQPSSTVGDETPETTEPALQQQAEFPEYVSIPGVISYDSPQTLLGQRELFLRNKTTPTLAPYGILPEQGAQSARMSRVANQYMEHDHDQHNNSSMSGQEASLDDLTLAQRKQLMRHNSVVSQASNINRTPSAAGMAYYTPNLSNTLNSNAYHQYVSADGAQFDSHQPQRSSSVPTAAQREQALASFRQTVASDLRSSSAMVNLPQSRTAPSSYRAPGQGVGLINYVQNSTAPSSGTSTPSGMAFQIDPTASLERSRSMLIAQKEQEARQREMDARRKDQNDQAFEEMMRRGDLLDAHRGALRRLQGTAR